VPVAVASSSSSSYKIPVRNGHDVRR
jgi:hypothetical protein